MSENSMLPVFIGYMATLVIMVTVLALGGIIALPALALPAEAAIGVGATSVLASVVRIVRDIW